MSNEIPFPRIQGNAIQKKDNTWSWEIYITIGDQPSIDVVRKDELPGFLSKELAISDLKTHAQSMAEEIAKTMGAEKLDGFMDLNKNMFVKKL